jgi:outer membrane protein OmpA-like peptidoglycan-associated protein
MVDFKTDNTALWKVVSSRLANTVKTRISIPEGRSYFSIASDKYKGLITYQTEFRARDGKAQVAIETFGGEAAKASIEAIIAKAPNDHIVKTATARQGAKNKDKWAWAITVSIENLTDEQLAEWYVKTISALYTFFEDAEKCADTVQNQEIDIESKVEGSVAEVSNAKVKVYGKAQNRTALGIVHAYMVMYPHANLDDLRKAFPDALNPQAPEEGLFMYATKPVPKGEYRSYFDQPEELLTTGDGKKVQFVCMWTKPAFENLAIHAKQYGIIIADFEKADGGAKKGGFRLEYLNGYIPPVVKKSKAGLWIAIAVVAVILALLAVLLGRKPEPQIVEVEKIVTVVDTVYVKQIEEIEKNFNAAEFVVGKSELSDDAKFVLHDLAKMMQKHPNLKLQLVGHTSAEGDAAFNQKLSEDRAQAAIDFLISHGGIDASRLEAIGKGSSELKNKENPMAPENRRTEFIVLE